MSLAYYNEHDSYAAHWLRNLIAAGHIAPGVVDERDIRDVRPEELIGFTQVHMFAGIGVWSHALRSAGWSDDRPIWTGSCPCQPFSAAGRAGGFTDERHLWPHWHWLIEQCRPAVVVGEQVASKDGLGWFDLVSADLEGSGYAVGASDLCAAGIGVDWQASQSGEWLRRAILDCVDPVVRSMLCDFADWVGAGNISEGGNHIRQRLYFVGLADTDGRDARTERQQPGGEYGQQPTDRGGIERVENTELSAQSRQRPVGGSNLSEQETAGLAGGCVADRLELSDGSDSGLLSGQAVIGMVDSDRRGAAPITGNGSEAGEETTRGTRTDDGSALSQRASGIERLADSDGQNSRTGLRDVDSTEYGFAATACGSGDGERADAANDGRYAKDWLFCRDDRWRAVEPRTFPLASNITARVGKLRAFGNALDAETATRFCEIVKEICDG